MFGMVNFIQNFVWNIWGFIIQFVKVVFGWSDSQIGQFVNMGNIVYFVIVFFGCYLIGKLGMYFIIFRQVILLIVL